MVILFMFTFSNTALAIEPPSEVKSLSATLGEQNEVILSWDEAESVDGVIIGYKIYFGTTSVETRDDVYDDEIEISATTSYSIPNLPTGKTYYFAITALDDEMNESDNYSEEASLEIPVISEEPNNEPTEEPVVEDPIIKDPIMEEPVYEDPFLNQQPPAQEETHSSPIMDTTPPIEVTFLNVDKSTLKSQKSVSISWQKSANLDGDVVDQIFYSKIGNGDWDSGYSIGKSLEEMVFDVEQDKNYQVKIVTVDSNGNKSAGKIISFSTETLANSGPAGTLALIIALSVISLFLLLRRKS
jgi:hypothetical protein